METTIHGYKTVSSYSRPRLLDNAWAYAGLAATIAAGVAGLIISTSDKPECDEMDTTERLLSGRNRDAILAAMERDKKGQFVMHGLLNA